MIYTLDQIETATAILPGLVAEDIMRRLDIRDATLIEYIEQRTVGVYNKHPWFRVGMDGDNGLDFFSAYAETWILGEHARRRKRRRMTA